jgi:hypothetical protein
MRETSGNVIGCRFSLSVMNDNYVEMILSSLRNVNTQNIWSITDALSTTYRGRQIHVLDALKACFVSINDGKTHITMEATFSKGDPEDSNEDLPQAETGALTNSACDKFDALCKISLYPLGIINYMDYVIYAIDLSKKKDLFIKSSHYAYEIEGGVNDIFDYFDEVMSFAESNTGHFVLQATLSVNSPSILKERSAK